MYCNKFHRYRCSHSRLESKSWSLVVVPESQYELHFFPRLAPWDGVFSEGCEIVATVLVMNRWDIKATDIWGGRRSRGQREVLRML